MSRWFKVNSLSIGRTPLVRSNRIVNRAGATVLAEIEGRSHACWVKSRIGAAMVRDAGSRGALGPGPENIEPTRVDTGVAPAVTAAARGIPVTLTIPETMSLGRRKLLTAHRGEVVMTPPPAQLSEGGAQ